MIRLDVVEDSSVFLSHGDLEFYECLLGDTVMGNPDSDIAVLVIHGFTGSNIENIYLGNELAKAGYRVYIPLLQGHGTDYKDLSKYKYEDWLSKVEESVNFLLSEKVGRKIFVAGHSMGGVLALNIATRMHLDGLILLATPYRYALALRLMVRMMSGLPVFTPFGSYYFEDPTIRDIPISKHFEKQYAKVKFSSINEVFEAQDEVYDKLDQIHAPCLLIYSEKDEIVPNSHAYQIYDGLASADKELVWVQNSDHILTIDGARDVVAEEIIEFVTRLTEDDCHDCSDVMAEC